MKLTAIRVENFKAIKDVKIDLTDVSLLVGSNNSGKSSLLQAVHFASRAMNQASEANKQSTISLREMEYVPTEMYSELSHNSNWGNRRDQPESRVAFELTGDDGSGNIRTLSATAALKSARNEGIALNPSIDSRLIQSFRGRNVVFSAYIPGIAGIPLQETFASKRNVYRKAASGDSNVVLRNILYLLGRNKVLDKTIERIREVYQDKSISVLVDFDNNADYNFRASFNIKGMISHKPLELAGTGMLQALQIFSYLYLFKPKIILIDEPEAHLHPPLQTRLLMVLQAAVQELGSTALITTHSPFVAAGLSRGARTVWLENGRLAATSRDSNIRDALQWGALDKKVIICAEDKDTSLLKNILSQDSDLERDVAIIPFSGVSKMGSGQALAAFRRSLGNKHKFIIYRDRDCLTESEIQKWYEEYKNLGYEALVSTGVEIENEYIDAANISSILGLDFSDVNDILITSENKNEEEIRKKFRSKRQEINIAVHRDGGSPSTDELWKELPNHMRFPGKTLLSKIYQEIEVRGVKRMNLLQTSDNVVIGVPLIASVRKTIYG
jgi:predicted ATPase